MLYRDQRGSLADSMRTTVRLKPTRRAMYSYLKNLSPSERFHMNDIEVEDYGYDPRIKWHTYIVSIKGDAVGFTDGPLED